MKFVTVFEVLLEEEAICQIFFTEFRN